VQVIDSFSIAGYVGVALKILVAAQTFDKDER
jgi:hypothetical protein